MPYLPNFKNSAANKTDPTVGDSTWALGSHECNIKIGVFTRSIIITESVSNSGTGEFVSVLTGVDTMAQKTLDL